VVTVWSRRRSEDQSGHLVGRVGLYALDHVLVGLPRDVGSNGRAARTRSSRPRRPSRQASPRCVADRADGCGVGPRTRLVGAGVRMSSRTLPGGTDVRPLGRADVRRPSTSFGGRLELLEP
jgi:hypothetical protein